MGSAAKKKPEPKAPVVEVLPAVMEKKPNPLTEKIKKPVSQEIAERAALKNDIETLTDLKNQLEERRNEANLLARLNDVEYVEKLDLFVSTVLDALTEDPEVTKEAIKTMVKSGNAAKLQNLMTTLGIAMDKRETLMGFDETRVGDRSKKKLKLQLAWKGSANGENTLAVQAEV